MIITPATPLNSDLVVVCDIEATCWVDGQSPPIDEMEVIEVGCVLCNWNGDIVDEFNTFVRPVKNPILSPFCKQLTSISQDNVENAPVFEEAMRLLDAWYSNRTQLWSSWGNYDKRLLLNQEQRGRSISDFIGTPHVNLKKSWRRTTKCRTHCGLQSALSFHGLSFEGKPHRAVSDARNTARLLPFIAPEEVARQLVSD
jgi:inhibitor of KinA sporulation pathway (predicted exonuclease)